MKKNHKQNIFQRFAIVILMIIIINFIIPTYSYAGGFSDFVGGVLLDPISDLVCFLGDTAIMLVQWCMTGELEWEGAIMVDQYTYFVNQAIREKDYTGAEVDGGIINRDDLVTGFFDKLGSTYSIPIITYSPEDIFKGDVPGLDINFINPEDPNSSSAILQTTISKWYYTLRNIAIVGLMVVLVYVGIRIVISSTAAEKAKYKQFFMDWLVAICLVFLLHYIMAFTVTMTQEIVEVISGEGSYINIKIDNNGDGIAEHSFKTNMLGQARFKVQYKDSFHKISYLAIYLFLVYYTGYFTFTYLKRLIMMAFLTIIAPLVALTYPIDKMNDGQAQAFNSWLKEYVYNSLIQPFHLILYIVFVGSAMDLAQSNMLYAIVAMWFITKAEEILRNFFGFNKAPSLGNTMTGFVGGLGASKLLNMFKGGGSGKKANGQTDKKDDQIRFEKKHDVDEIDPLGEGKGSGKGLEDKNRKIPLEDRWKNWKNAHGGGKKIIKGVGKRFSKAAFSGAGIALGAVAGAATGKGLGGMLAGAAAGGKVGGALGDKTVGLIGKVGRGVGRVKDASVALSKKDGEGAKEAILGGTMLGGAIDKGRGDTKYEDAGRARSFKNDPNNLQYIRDQMTAANGGVVPSTAEVKAKMNSLDPYIEQGLSDIKTMLKAQKAEAYTSPQQSALIAAIGKERGITADILNDDKKARATQANLQQEFINKGFDEAKAARQADYTMNILKVQNGLAHNLGKGKK